MKRSDVKKITPLMLRHSFATHLAMKGGQAEIAGLLGDSLRVTEPSTRATNRASAMHWDACDVAFCDGRLDSLSHFRHEVL